MSAQDLEQRAREFLAAEYEREGFAHSASCILSDARLVGDEKRAHRAIVAALRQQPAPVDLEQFREAVDFMLMHGDMLQAIIDNAGEMASAGLRVVLLGDAVAALSAIDDGESFSKVANALDGKAFRVPTAPHQPAPVVDDELPGMWSQSDFMGGATDATDNARQPAPVAEDAMVGVLAALKDARTFVTHAHCQIAAPIGTLEKYDAATAAVNELIEVAAQIKARLDARRAKAFAERGGWQWHSREDEGDYERLCAALALAQGVRS